MGTVHRRASVLAGILLACCASVSALDPALDVSQYAHTAWKVRDGFTKGIITSLAQTPDGYLWLGTETGLLRFDGVRAVPWQPAAAEQLPGSLITDLLATRDGTLWIATFTGLASWKNGKLRAFPDLAHQNIQSLVEDRDGAVWISTYAESGGKLCSIRSEILHCETLPTGSKSLYEDKQGSLWVGVSDGFWRWKPGPAKFFRIPSDSFGVTSFAEDEQGHLLIGSYAGVRRLVDDRIEPYASLVTAVGAVSPAGVAIAA